jgi:type VI secretion system protein VasG
MATVKRSELVQRLNATCRQALESAGRSARIRGNPYAELVHWVEQLCLTENSDAQAIIRFFDIDASNLATDMTKAIDALPRGSTSLNDFSEHIFDAIERAWTLGSLRFEGTNVRSGHLILGILETPGLDRLLHRVSSDFERIDPHLLAEQFPSIVNGSLEDGASIGQQTTSADNGNISGGGTSSLETYATDLTARARDGQIDPITGRDPEIRQIVNILMRRRQNNPILTGEAGVGKTAVVEGFALRIAAGDVPPQLQNVQLWMLDIGLLQAGASMRGEFEKRLRGVIDEVQASEVPIILFIDEAHTLIGAGGASGTGDAANLLKPALARGELRTVAATTWSEYKRHIEKDPALTRRFEVVQIDEPDETRALQMMRGIVGTLEQFHRLEVLDEATRAAVQLSKRYIPARQLPDKAVSLLDTACARVGVSHYATPAQVEDRRRQIDTLTVESQILAREAAMVLEVNARQEQVEKELAETKTGLETLETRWQEEKGLVDEILALRRSLREDGLNPDQDTRLADEVQEELQAGSEIESALPEHSEAMATAAPFDREEALAELKQKLANLATMQGEEPLIVPTVDFQAVAAVVQDWTGIPVGRMQTDDIQNVLDLPKILAHRVIGQDHAMELIAKRIQTSRAHLDAPNKPVGVFMLCGPSGVGKTETALALAESMYGGEQNLITINMSEFQEAHTVSTLKGAPPGYVGYGEGGVLTEAVRRRPYSVVLLDEVEKAHSDVHEIFFQVFDKGQMEDGEGRRIDFKNTLILLTSNVGSELIMQMFDDPELEPNPEAVADGLRPPLLQVFPPALLGRLVVIPYRPLNTEMMDAIIKLQLSHIIQRLSDIHGVTLTYDQDVLELIRDRCTELESGGRMIDAILTNTLLPHLSRELLGRQIEKEEVHSASIGVDNGEFTYAFA